MEEQVKRLLYFICLIVYLLYCCVYASEQTSIEIQSGEETATQWQSGEQREIENVSGEAQTKNMSGEQNNQENETKTDKLPEEGANVDTSNTKQNYTVEAPTIVLLILFGILVIGALILIIFKI